MSTPSFRGVCYCRKNKWRAQIQHELGVRQDAESAALPLVFGVVETLRAQCVHDRGAAEDA